MEEDIELFEVKQIKDYVDKLQQIINKKDEEINKIKIDLSGGKVQQLKKYELSSLGYSFYDYEPYKNRYSDKINIELAQKKIDELYEKDKLAYEENLKIIEQNKIIKERVITILKSLGLSEREYTFKSSRSRTKDWSIAAWVSSINGLIITYCSNPKDIYVNFGARLENIQKEEKEKSDKEKLKLKTIASFEIKYNQEFESIEEVKYYILEKDKYLRLAYYLQMNRNDWSDGSDYAETGLYNFKIETDIDQKIYDEINGLIKNWDCDGRVFRDCKYNYTELYQMANEELYIDLKKLLQFEEQSDRLLYG